MIACERHAPTETVLFGDASGCRVCKLEAEVERFGAEFDKIQAWIRSRPPQSMSYRLGTSLMDIMRATIEDLESEVADLKQQLDRAHQAGLFGT